MDEDQLLLFQDALDKADISIPSPPYEVMEDFVLPLGLEELGVDEHRDIIRGLDPTLRSDVQPFNVGGKVVL